MPLHRQNGSTFKRREIQPDGTIKVAKRWSIKFRDPSGRQIVEVVGPKKKEAMARLQEKLAAMRTGTYQTLKAIAFKAYVPQWLAARQPTLKPSTYRTFAGLLGALPTGPGRHARSPVQHFGECLMDAITPEMIATYLGSLTTAKLRPKSVGNVKGLLSSLFEDARAGGYVGTNPVKNRLVRTAKALAPGDHEEMIVPSPPQVAALLNFLDAHDDPRLYAYALTMAATGCRPGECAALMVKDLIPVAGQIRIERAYDPRARKVVLPKSRSSSRTIDAGPSVFAALARVADLSQPESFILAEPDGGPLDFHKVRKGWATLQVAAGCGFFPAYSLRHYAASRMLQEGESLAYVSRQLGHAKQSMTLGHYSHFIPDHKRQRGADRLAAELLGVTTPLPIQSERGRNRANQAEEVEAQVSNNPIHS